jgi:hypothetical protein
MGNNKKRKRKETFSTTRQGDIFVYKRQFDPFKIASNKGSNEWSPQNDQ